VNTTQAKRILLLYRPGIRDTEDPEMLEAIELATKDPELGKWFEQHQAFQLAMRAKLREIHVPEHLKRSLLVRPKIVRPAITFWNNPVWMAAAAIFLVLVGLSVFWLRPSVPDRFTHYRETMVSAAVRMYSMDLVTSDASKLRQFVATNGAPADYMLTQGLARLPLKGGGLLRWRGNPVSMVCFDRAGTTLFLFVLKRSALKDPPPELISKAEVAQVDGLITASWTRGDDTYLLAGPHEPGFAQKYVISP
jgi:hypothetical protein